MNEFHIHTQQERGVMTIGKICEADLPKNKFNIHQVTLEV